MRILHLALLAIAISLISALFLSERPAAQSCPGTSALCPAVETFHTLSTSNPSPVPGYVYTSGYAVAADGGGGVLYIRSGTSCSPPPNSSLIVKDGGGNCWYAQKFPQDVRQWGALCDAANSAVPGVIAASTSTLYAPSDLTGSLTGNRYPIHNMEPIVITGAGPGGAPLATTVNGTPTTY